MRNSASQISIGTLHYSNESYLDTLTTVSANSTSADYKKANKKNSTFE